MSLPSRVDAEFTLVADRAKTNSVRVSLSTTTARSAQLTSRAHYWVTSSVDCFILQGGSTVDAATATSQFLPAKQPRAISVSGSSDDYIAGIVSAGTGTLYIDRRG